MKVGDTIQGGTAVQLVTLQMCTHTCGVRTTTWLSYSHITLDNIVNHLTCRGHTQTLECIKCQIPHFCPLSKLRQQHYWYRCNRSHH